LQAFVLIDGGMCAMRIVFIGPPGVGKGTQCKRLAAHFRIAHLSTGEMLRSVDKESALGSLIGSYIDAGGLAPDNLVMRIVRKRLLADDCLNGCLFDGFPRTLVQAESLDQYMVASGDKLCIVISLEADTTELIDRLLKRAEQENRIDDTAETIQRRLEVFREKTAPVLDYYAAQGLVQPIDAMQSPDTIFDSICVQISRRCA
jgi:adenylate kinase